MQTLFDPKNKLFSDAAHMIARRQIYPTLFNAPPNTLSFQEQTLLEHGKRGELLDGQMAIDRIVEVSNTAYQYPFVMTVQERFRRTTYAHKRDITITEWNGASNLPSELFKITANLFVYGYFDDKKQTFTEWVAVSVPTLILALASGRIPRIWRPNRKKQTFITVTFQQLYEVSAIVKHARRKELA